jgi:hypothetical protein
MKYPGRALALMTLLSVIWPGVLIARENTARGEFANKRGELEISGEYLDYIYIALKDYDGGEGYCRPNLRYCRFTVSDVVGDLVVISISYNNKLLMKEKNVVMAGGGADYTFKKGSREIVRKKYYQ